MSPIVDFLMVSLPLVLLLIDLPTLLVAQCGSKKKRAKKQKRKKSTKLIKPASAFKIPLGQKNFVELNQKEKGIVIENKREEKPNDKKTAVGLDVLKEPEKAAIKKEKIGKDDEVAPKPLNDKAPGKKNRTVGADKGNKIEPKMINLDRKAQKISDTKAKCDKGDYPTMNDVLSDWDSDKEKQKELAAGKNGSKPKEKHPATDKEDFNIELKAHTGSKTPCGERRKQDTLTDDEDDGSETLKNVKSLAADPKQPSTIEE
ncbi:hypothetical protein M3Y97_00314200 [Aphelenchoides bicaudatus]|nr:hypothetical protein M3Y97_00314200 [Aphelenchoides bicaudatus]